MTPEPLDIWIRSRSDPAEPLELPPQAERIKEDRPQRARAERCIMGFMAWGCWQDRSNEGARQDSAPSVRKPACFSGSRSMEGCRAPAAARRSVFAGVSGAGGVLAHLARGAVARAAPGWTARSQGLGYSSSGPLARRKHPGFEPPRAPERSRREGSCPKSVPKAGPIRAGRARAAVLRLRAS